MIRNKRQKTPNVNTPNPTEKIYQLAIDQATPIHFPRRNIASKLNMPKLKLPSSPTYTNQDISAVVTTDRERSGDKVHEDNLYKCNVGQTTGYSLLNVNRLNLTPRRDNSNASSPRRQNHSELIKTKTAYQRFP